MVAESLTEADNQFTFGPTKTHQVREVPLPRSLPADLERHLDTEVARRLGHSRASITTRHYARPMGGGDTVVADRLDRARQAARATGSAPEMPSHLARIWHESSSDPDCQGGDPAAHQV